MNTHSKYYWFLIAGLLGGLSEVVWISLYSLATNIQLSDIGSAITATIFPSNGFSDTYDFIHLISIRFWTVTFALNRTSRL